MAAQPSRLSPGELSLLLLPAWHWLPSAPCAPQPRHPPADSRYWPSSTHSLTLPRFWEQEAHGRARQNPGTAILWGPASQVLAEDDGHTDSWELGKVATHPSVLLTDDDARRRQSLRKRTEDRDRRCVKIREVRSFEEGNWPHISKHMLAPATACFTHARLSSRQRQFVTHWGQAVGRSEKRSRIARWVPSVCPLSDLRLRG